MVGFSSKQIFISACLIASLFVGSASACACSHHAPEPEKAETETSSCHSHSKDTEAHQADADGSSFASGDGCICAGFAQRTAAKSEAVKLKKSAATIAQQPKATNVTREQFIATKANFVAKRFYLSNSFYASAPKRGPPRA